MGYHHGKLDEPVTSDFDNLIAQWEADASLFDPDHLLKRIEALDALDVYVGIPEQELSPHRTSIVARATLLRSKLESANAAIYNSIRTEIQRGNPPAQLLHWIDRCSGNINTPHPGLGYDVLDELISGILQAREPETAPHRLPPDMVFYQPTPARHILQFIRLSALTESDTLVDLGSGLGHVPILASILTGAQCIGIEAESAYVESAGDCARNLHLNRVTFLHQDATNANLSPGTVFYLYTPFTGNTLKAVLKKLHNVSTERPITIGTLGPCTPTVAAESWLAPLTIPDPNQITLFRPMP
jgi:hypothetical protein